MGRQLKELTDNDVKVKKYVTTEEDCKRAAIRKKIELYNEEKELERMCNIDYHL